MTTKKRRQKDEKLSTGSEDFEPGRSLELAQERVLMSQIYIPSIFEL